MLISLFTLICCCLLTSYGALIAYYRKSWNDIPEFDPAAASSAPTHTPIPASAHTPIPTQTRISVLIPARNEEANIARCIESLSRQSYPKTQYQVIVIDDHSTDKTRDIVTGFLPQEMNLVYIRLADFIPPGQVAYKKLAIQTGIGIASGDLIVTTDADCRFHPDWLTTLAAFHGQKAAKFIAAPVRMGEARIGAAPRNPNATAISFLSIFQTLDFISLQGITGAAVDKNFHSMCNGANLAYEKTAFYEVGGFTGIDAIPSGDDMLLMHKIYTRYPDKVFFLKSPSAVVSTNPETSWTALFHQRVRWASKADRYDDKRIFWVLLLVYLVNAMFILLSVAACWRSAWLWLVVIGLIAKTMIEFPFVYTVAGFFEQRPLIRWFPIMQPLHIFYTIVIGWMGKFGGYRWKERTIVK